MTNFRQMEYRNGFDLGLECLKSGNELPDISLCAKPFRVGVLDAYYEKPSCNPWGTKESALESVGKGLITFDGCYFKAK